MVHIMTSFRAFCTLLVLSICTNLITQTHSTPLPVNTNLLVGLANNADSPHNMWVFRLALAEINNITDPMHPYYVPTTITHTWVNTGTSVIAGYNGLIPEFNRIHDSTVMMLGEKNSAYAAAGIQLAAYYNRSTLINAGLGALLNDRQLFSSSVRVVSNDAGFVESWLLMIKLYGWKQFALLVTEDDQGIAFYEALSAALPSGVVMTVFSCPIAKQFQSNAMRDLYYQNVMTVVKRSGLPIVLTIGTPASVAVFLDLAYKNGILGENTGFQWFVAGSTCTNANMSPVGTGPSLKAVASAICVMNSYDSGPLFDAFNERIWTESAGSVKRTANMALVGAFYDTAYFIVEALRIVNRSSSTRPVYEQMLDAMFQVDIIGPSTGRRMNIDRETGQVFTNVDFMVVQLSNTTNVHGNVTTWKIEGWKRLGGYNGLDKVINLNEPFTFQDGNQSAVGVLSEMNLGYKIIDYFPNVPDGASVEMEDTQWAYIVIVFVLGIMHGCNALSCLASSIKTALRLESSSVKKTVNREALTLYQQRPQAASDHANNQHHISSALTWGFVKATMVRKSHAYRWSSTVFLWFFVCRTSLSLFYIVPSHFLVLLFQSFSVSGIDAHFNVPYLVGSILVCWAGVNASIAVLLWHHYQAAVKMSVQLVDAEHVGKSAAWKELFHPYIWLSTLLLDAAICIPFHMSRQALVLPVETTINASEVAAAPLVLLVPLYGCLYWMLPIAANAEAEWSGRFWSVLTALCIISSQWIMAIQSYSYTFVNALIKQSWDWDVSQLWVLTALLMGIGVFLYTGLNIHRNQFSVSVMDLQLSKQQAEEVAIRHRNELKQQEIEKLETTLADCQQTLLRIKHGRPGFRPVALLLLKQELASGDKSTFDDELMVVQNQTRESADESDFHGTSLPAIVNDVVLCEHLKDHLAHSTEAQDLIALYQDIQQFKHMKNHDLRQEFWNRFSHQIQQYNLSVSMSDVDRVERYVLDELLQPYQATALYRYSRAQFDLL